MLLCKNLIKISMITTQKFSYNPEKDTTKTNILFKKKGHKVENKECKINSTDNFFFFFTECQTSIFQLSLVREIFWAQWDKPR